MTTDSGITIERLVGNLEPVARLFSPTMRCLIWLLAVTPYVAGLVLMFSLRPDLGARIADVRFTLELGAAFATALSASWAAFSMTIPGYDPRYAAIPLAPLAVWIGILVEGCVEDLLTFGWSGMTLDADWICFPIIALVGAWPAVLMALMLRRGGTARAFQNNRDRGTCIGRTWKRRTPAIPCTGRQYHRARLAGGKHNDPGLAGRRVRPADPEMADGTGPEAPVFRASARLNTGTRAVRRRPEKSTAGHVTFAVFLAK